METGYGDTHIHVGDTTSDIQVIHEAFCGGDIYIGLDAFARHVCLLFLFFFFRCTLNHSKSLDHHYKLRISQLAME